MENSGRTMFMNRIGAMNPELAYPWPSKSTGFPMFMFGTTTRVSSRLQQHTQHLPALKTISGRSTLCSSYHFHAACSASVLLAAYTSSSPGSAASLTLLTVSSFHVSVVSSTGSRPFVLVMTAEDDDVNTTRLTLPSAYAARIALSAPSTALGRSALLRR